MSFYHQALLLIGVFAFNSYASLQSSNVNLMGGIIESACSISTDDVWQEVNFGTISSSDFAKGLIPHSKPLNIHLRNCVLERNNDGTWSDVSVTFDGKTDDNQASVFSINGEDIGVGLKIKDKAGRIVMPGRRLSDVKIHKENAHLHFNIEIAKTKKDISTRDISSFIHLILAYQ